VNSGKSTLFNTLVGCERAIVSPRPGTTRDTIEAQIQVAGIAVTLVDTAGLGESGDVVELEGMRRAEAAVAGAEGTIHLWAADAPGPPPQREHCRTVLVRSKADLARGAPLPSWLDVSCRSGAGVERLRSRLARLVTDEVVDLGGEVAIGARHRACLESAERELAGCDFAAPELAAQNLRWAVDALAEVMGEVGVEEVLDEVFGTFCIGK
jgi:tRNA modification GTPase